MVDTSLDLTRQIDVKKSAIECYDLVASNSVLVNGNIVATGSLTGSNIISSGSISGSGATVTLTAAQSGQTVIMDRAAGITFTLPAPTVGLVYNFYVKTSVTSNSYKVITDAGTTLLTGTVIGANTASSDAMLAFSGNASTHIAFTQAAASTNATGGLIGSWVRFVCISPTLWLVNGIINAGTTFTTPFATS